MEVGGGGICMWLHIIELPDVVHYSGCFCCSPPSATFERSLVGNLSTAKDYLQLWTSYCDFYRRRVSKENPQEAELVDLRKTFKRARDYMEACKSAFPTREMSASPSNVWKQIGGGGGGGGGGKLTVSHCVESIVELLDKAKEFTHTCCVVYSRPRGGAGDNVKGKVGDEGRAGDNVRGLLYRTACRL